MSAREVEERRERPGGRRSCTDIVAALPGNWTKMRDGAEAPAGCLGAGRGTTREQFRSSKGQSRPTIDIGTIDREGRIAMVVRVHVTDSDGAGELIRLLVQMI